jgi:purine-binding chemotaxis protein CheW
VNTTIKSNPASKTKTADASGPARKLLSFGLGKEEYGLDILAVREIIGVIDITPLPRTPSYVKGVINLRGKIIPVIELRSRFGLTPVPYTEETCIIVVDVPTDGQGESESRLMGVVVDTVREVLDIPTSAIEPTPEFGCSIPMDYITGIGKVKDKVVVMLDATKVMSPTEAGALSSALKSEEPSALAQAA